MSAATAPQSFAQPGPGSTGAAERLMAAVRSTESLPSFTVTIDRQPLVILYQAPNRFELLWQGPTEVGDPSLTHVTIGDELFAPNSQVPNQWDEQPAPSGSSDVRHLFGLDVLLHAGNVTQDGDRFQSVEIAPNGLAELCATTIVVAGHVVAETVTETAKGRTLTGHFGYSRLGTSPPVTLPPNAEIVKDAKCGPLYAPPDSAWCAQPAHVGRATEDPRRGVVWPS